MTLTADTVHLGYDKREVVHGIDLDVPSGAVTVVVGANGCGKSTLLRGLGRLLKPTSGRVTLDGRDVSAIGTRRLAAELGLLPQQPVAPEGITVGDLVGRGRYPHQGPFRRWTSDDSAIVAHALAATGTHELADRRMDELSGGQRQRVWIAMALAQQTDVLLLDEPTTYLDVAHQIEVLDLLASVNRERGTTIVMVLHDLNLAARYADHLVVMTEGRVLTEGVPAQVLTEETVRAAFGLSCVVVPDPVTGGPLVVPVSAQRPAVTPGPS
ncbi:MAG: ABC transporter ATP-binding protein [Nocardioides sp.]